MESFITKSKNKFGDTYSYDNLNYITSKEKVFLKCIIHNYEFSTLPKNHLETKIGGCKKCDLKSRYDKLQLESNNKYNNNYIIDENSFVNYSIKVKIKCTKHNYIFKCLVQHHLKTPGCKNCLVKENFIQKCNIKFSNNFDYSQTNDLTNQTQLIKIRCKKHDIIFDIIANYHTFTQFGGCKKCKKDNDVQSTLVKKPRRIHNIIIKNDEIFKKVNIEGYNKFYEVSNYGNIYSIRTKKHLNPYLSNGYKLIRLNNEGMTKLFRVHRLVAFTFLEKDEKRDFVDHIDRNRSNNHVKNLRWVTHEENMLNKGIRKKTFKSEKTIESGIDEFHEIKKNGKYYFPDYKISKNGTVINKYNKPMSPALFDGYYHVSLMCGKKLMTQRVHRLVAITYCIKNQNQDTVNHIDGNKLNNNYLNLEWCNNKYNTREHFKKQIAQIDIETNKIIKIYTHFNDIYKDFNKSYCSGVSKCCKGYAHTALGYEWKIV